MSDLNETFFTSVGCMDGRVQAPIAEFGKKRYNVLYPDTITEAGMVWLLADNPSVEFLDGLKKKVLISVDKHHSKGIIVHGHQKCAGNPVEDELHKEHVLKAAQEIREMAPNTEVVPVFVSENNGQWVVEEL